MKVITHHAAVHDVVKTPLVSRRLLATAFLVAALSLLAVFGSDAFGSVAGLRDIPLGLAFLAGCLMLAFGGLGRVRKPWAKDLRKHVSIWLTIVGMIAVAYLVIR